MAFAAACSAAVAGTPGVSFGAWQESDANSADITWHKSPCRFCGVGCSLLLGISNGRAVAVKGDPRGAANRGLACVKGFHSVQALYGSDRLKKALVKKDGKMVEVPITEALDLVAAKMKESIDKHGKDSVAMYTSGQSTIPDGYAASKFMKGCIGTNNLDCNARLCMASAVTGFMTSFGIDEPMGCYEDFDHADVFVTWGNNMAEMHPVLFSRMLDRRQRDKKVTIVALETRTTRSGVASDKQMIFQPNTDLAIANCISHLIVKNGWVDADFVKNYVSIKKGRTAIEGPDGLGYGLGEKDGLQKDKPEPATWEEYVKFLEDYTPEAVEKISGVKADDLRTLGALYGDPARKVMSLWCMGMNQHTRGTWINNLVYNLHLLTGKISKPGNSPFSLTGQPSACGTAREVGTFTHRLPHGVVSDEHSRHMAAEIWGVPYERIPSKPTYSAVPMFRALDRGDLKFIWIQCTNPMVTLPNHNRYRDGSLKEDRFVVVSDVYPTPTTDVADVILPAAMWIEREGMYGNSERRTQHFDKLIAPASEDCWPDAVQTMYVAKKLGFDKEFPWTPENYAEGMYREYCKFQEGALHGMAPYEVLKARPGVLWPYVNGKSTRWRFNSALDPACTNGKAFHFYGNKDGKANLWLRPYQKPAESPDTEYPFWLNTGRVLEHWHSGSMTRRIPALHGSVPESYCEMHEEDARALEVYDGDMVKLTTRRGVLEIPARINGRGRPVRGQVFVPFFDENYMINKLTIDAFDPYSNQPDYKKCAVRVEKA
jgi:nitrate reductase NapA